LGFFQEVQRFFFFALTFYPESPMENNKKSNAKISFRWTFGVEGLDILKGLVKQSKQP